MGRDPHRHHDDPEPDAPDHSVDPFEDEEDDEEIPTSVMVVLIVLVVGAVALYLILGGGHQHFH
jgi:hypothetical protein